MTTVLIIWFVTMIPYGIYLNYKIKRDLHVLQMNSYRFERYMLWFRQNRDVNFRWIEMLPLLAAIPVFVMANEQSLIIYKVIFVMLYIILILARVRYNDKKKLVMTSRVRRIFTVTLLKFLLISAIILLAYIKYLENPTTLKLFILVGAEILLFTEFTAASFAPVLSANIVLAPVEVMIQKKFYNKAKKTLKDMSELKIVGITGSYGKTSTKMIVGDILAEKFNICRTPHSYNTLMGVVRTVNETLKKTDQVFVVEMGAKQKGDIKEICDLVHPDYGILTAIGPQHLETFRTIENTKATKYELIESLDNTGKAVYNMDNTYIKEIIEDEALTAPRHETICYSLEDANAEYYAKNIRYTNDGSVFTIVNNGEEIEVKSPLLGVYNIYNVLAGVTVAVELGMTLVEIKRAIAKIRPIEHRLELKRTPSGVTIIDDAFNANPEGSKMALEVLKIMEGERKIIITPGMIELGDRQYELNKAFGKHCAGVCDYIILVGAAQTVPIQDGIAEAGYDKRKLYIAKNLTDANEHLRSMTRAGDVVLFENDLLEDK